MLNNYTSLMDQFPQERQTPDQEAALVCRVKTGSQAALSKLVMANMREALLYTGRVCGGELSEGDLISLCYQEMSMSARRFTSGNLRFFAFAKAGLRGRLKTFWKSLKLVRNAESVIPLEDLEKNYAPPPISPDDDPEHSHREKATGEVVNPDWEKMFAVDQWSQIKEALKDTLSKQQWMVLDLVYQSGLNFPDIAKLLGLTRSAIHAAHRNAIAKLRDGIRANPRLLYVEDTRS